jgi:hypothetical protein
MAHVLYLKRGKLGKPYGIKMGYYSKHLGKDIGNNRKSNNPNTPTLVKRKKPWVSWVYVSLTHWLSKISICTFVSHHFQPI